MEPQHELHSGSRMDSVFLSASVLLLAGGMLSFYALEPQLNGFVRLLILLVCLAAALAAGYRTQLGHAIATYLFGARAELRKVVWPSKKDTTQVTLMIAAVVLLMALILWGLDSALLWGVKLLTGQE